MLSSNWVTWKKSLVDEETYYGDLGSIMAAAAGIVWRDNFDVRRKGFFFTTEPMVVVVVVLLS